MGHMKRASQNSNGKRKLKAKKIGFVHFHISWQFLFFHPGSVVHERQIHIIRIQMVSFVTRYDRFAPSLLNRVPKTHLDKREQK